MRNGLRIITLLIGLLAAVPGLRAESRKVQGIYVLPDIGLSEFLDDELGLPGIDDHNINLGGIGSDLWHSEEDDDDDRGGRRGDRDEDEGGGIYWMITDRGPNDEDPRTFPVPEFTPFILKVRTTKGAIKILKAIPITGMNVTMNGVTGIPNLNNTTEPPALNEAFYDCFGLAGNELSVNPHGFDTEGIVRTSDGTFWIVEEYGPSIVKVNPKGKVLKRFFPQDLLDFLSPITGYGTDDSALSVPELYGLKRKLNRGFEGIALSPDEETLYIALQSPLVNPDTATGNASRNTRILAFDIATEQVIGEYVYRFQPAAEFNVANQPNPPFDPNRARDMKISALAMLDKHRMLVLERTDFIAKIYRVDLRKATNILGSVWDDVNKPAPSLEALNADGELESNGITSLPKQFVLTLDSTVPVNGMAIPQKVEGMTVLDGKTIAIANDNDFGVGAFQIDDQVDPPTCTLINSGRESQIIVIRLDKSLKK